ncbi:E3 ubiquitin-protein ligase TTC3 [Portunus trituberculatus]|uniref:E3 ubiquitin-protein ligase TTC3 n=1 Tax=Portunus trituberculatus TaxID=210409 RepID=A0A5B7DJ43_PORTR|nr:E3 ubiquitin-protein ligase TTC3 [Portunus trituberculatus]
MNDYGMHHLYIENYTLLANHTDVPQVLGSLRDKSDYRDNMKTVLSVLTTWIPEDEQLTWEFSSNESLLRQQEERDRLREQGNTFFKQNDFNRAIDFYNVAKVEDPYDCRVWSNCSHAYFKLKDYLLAEVHAIVAMKLNPFYEKAYYRAGQAAIKQRHWWEGEEYAKCGIFICGETKELRQILDDAARIPLNDSGILGSLISDSIDGYVRDQAKTFIHSALESLDLKPNNPVKLSEPYNVQVVQLVIGVCKVQSTRGYIFEGLEIMQTLLGPSSKFSHKPACRYWLAVSFEKICCFKLSQKHAQLCKDALKKSKNIKPIKWPATEQLINWTRCDVLETECNLLLEKLSSSRPSPKAKCRYKNCITTQGIPYAKDEIYLTDPDFKGYLNVICEEDCTVSYHPCCWKAFKEQHDGSVNRMSDKDFLGELCVTPDCTGKISSIQIYDDEGRMKNELAKDKKDRKHMAAPVKQKKKKDKKKEKPQSHKKRTRVESVCEDLATNDDTSPTAAESSSIQNAHTNSNNNSSSNNNDKHKSSQKPQLPIDPESLEKAQVTILKPGAETEEVSPTKSTKKNKKKKVKKPVNQPNLLGDPLEADLCVQSEYIARLRMLRQQRDALEAGECPNLIKPINVTTDTQKPVVLLDPDNPFYLPQHLRDNPEELERVLQEKLTTSSPPGLQQETINTLLE